MVLAGGKGERLYPLTKERAKPAVPFGGIYRIIDFTLSNCINSGMRRVRVLTQYKSESLIKHLQLAWNILNYELEEYIIAVPAQMRVGPSWYKATGDAIFQNLHAVYDDKPKDVLILSGDHIYKMDYGKMVKFHRKKKADMTVAAIELDIRLARSSLGVLSVDNDQKITKFIEKPMKPEPIINKPDKAYVNMGIYLFKSEFLIRMLEEDADMSSTHDFGRDIIPYSIKTSNVYAFDFIDKNMKNEKYWRDVGNVDTYWQANMDLVSVNPLFNLYSKVWPIRTYHGQSPPAKTVFAQEFEGGRLGIAIDSILSSGVIISGGKVKNSVLSPEVRIRSHALVEQCILMENVIVGRNAKLKKVIVDKDVVIPDGEEIGYNRTTDAQRFYISKGGVVVIPKGKVF
ncbi:glucose-1-phosphate adenylyltransferase [bacterium]|nr:glucose-1-phosphate adenylyltransferase [bacterium]